MVRFTFGVFLFTGVLAVVAAIQTWAFIQSERGFVVPTEAKFEEWPIIPGIIEPLTINVTFKNIGKSTTTFEEMSVITADGLPDDPDFSHGNRVTVPPLPAGGERPVQTYFGSVVPPEFVADLEAGRRKFFFFGRVLYRDDYSLGIFGPRESRFCYEFRPLNGGKSYVLEPCRNRKYTETK